MIDAIASSRFLSEKRSRVLIDKLKSLCSHYDAQPLQRQVLLANRVKGVSKVLHINVDVISEAIYENRLIQFRYFKYNTRKERQFNKRDYKLHPEQTKKRSLPPCFATFVTNKNTCKPLCHKALRIALFQNHGTFGDSSPFSSPTRFSKK